jgi:hypothetical protein
MKLFLREHHSNSLGPTARPGDSTEEADSYQNAWFPENTTFAEDKVRYHDCTDPCYADRWRCVLLPRGRTPAHFFRLSRRVGDTE